MAVFVVAPLDVAALGSRTAAVGVIKPGHGARTQRAASNPFTVPFLFPSAATITGGVHVHPHVDGERGRPIAG